MDKKISIVMAYHNRRDQILFTLKTIKNSEHKNYEIIIVDDVSDKNQQLDDIVNNDQNIKYIKLEKKISINPCNVYNLGFKHATGDIVIIQNPECCHIGDIIKYTNDNLKPNQYFSFACANLQNIEKNNILYNMYENNESKQTITNFLNTLPLSTWETILWYNHPIHRPVGFHFMSAIYKSDLDKLGGFDERYADGVGYDDNELVERIKLGKIEFIFLNTDKPFAIHQWHPKSNTLIDKELINKNRLVYNNHMLELGINSRYDVI